MTREPPGVSFGVTTIKNKVNIVDNGSRSHDYEITKVSICDSHSQQIQRSWCYIIRVGDCLPGHSLLILRMRVFWWRQRNSNVALWWWACGGCIFNISLIHICILYSTNCAILLPHKNVLWQWNGVAPTPAANCLKNPARMRTYKIVQNCYFVGTDRKPPARKIFPGCATHTYKCCAKLIFFYLSCRRTMDQNHQESLSTGPLARPIFPLHHYLLRLRASLRSFICTLARGKVSD